MDKLRKYLIIGTIFTVIMGTISHFVYDLTGENFIIGLFFPVNESTWEHMKLVFFPMLVYSIWLSNRLKGDMPCILSDLTLGVFAGTFAIPVIFYIYSGILGFNVGWLNILTFVVSVIIGYLVVYVIIAASTGAKKCSNKYSGILKAALFIMIVAFMIFTYYPPDIGLFWEG